MSREVHDVGVVAPARVALRALLVETLPDGIVEIVLGNVANIAGRATNPDLSKCLTLVLISGGQVYTEIVDIFGC